ncbi:MAG: GNAT family N-acetyltransferase [Syntrophothermus sp.]
MAEYRKYTIRTMTSDEVENIAVKWADAEGWNPGLYDSECFYNTDPEGFLIGLLDGKPAACISAVKYDDSFGFIGFYIVSPEFRGQGYGIKIWNAAMEYLKGTNTGLDGVVVQQGNYAKSGFRLAYSNIRHQGISFVSPYKFPEILNISEVPFEKILEYDKCTFPAPRENFLKSWLKQPESYAVASMSGVELNGFAVIRKCRTGYKIGPLFADDFVVAERLFLALNNFPEPGSRIYLDTPETNLQAVQLAKIYKMEKVFETARMYTGGFPPIDISRVYGVTTFELG